MSQMRSAHLVMGSPVRPPVPRAGTQLDLRERCGTARFPIDSLARWVATYPCSRQCLARKGVRAEFVKECLVLVGRTPLANLMLSGHGRLHKSRTRPDYGASWGRYRPGATARARKEGEKDTNHGTVGRLVELASSRVPKVILAREYGISRGRPGSIWATPSWRESFPVVARLVRQATSFTESALSAFKGRQE